VIDPLSPLAAAATLAWPDHSMPDCFVAAAQEEFIPIVDLDEEQAWGDLPRAAH
jgi:hypothetical protein